MQFGLCVLSYPTPKGKQFGSGNHLLTAFWMFANRCQVGQMLFFINTRQIWLKKIDENWLQKMIYVEILLKGLVIIIQKLYLQTLNAHWISMRHAFIYIFSMEIGKDNAAIHGKEQFLSQQTKKKRKKKCYEMLTKTLLFFFLIILFKIWKRRNSFKNIHEIHQYFMVKLFFNSSTYVIIHLQLVKYMLQFIILFFEGNKSDKEITIIFDEHRNVLVLYLRNEGKIVDSMI